MGSRPSVQVESPPFNPSEWKYLPEREDTHQDYGYFRTLQHVSTGEKIDEYDYIWQNEEEFEYYLKSYNWRYKEPNVVRTKYIDLQNKNEFCSQSYMARVYIEHISVRISEIFDIPYPENLYIMMESLEGYSRIYHHSKFFFIEENQICVDEAGKVKIWVNGDLSINYPNTHGQEIEGEGEEEMVDMLIKIITDNTDPDSEPEPKFIDYYHKKKGLRGKNFQEAKVLVQAYARINSIEIPQRFEAILNTESQEALQLNSFTGNSKTFSVASKRTSNLEQNYTNLGYNVNHSQLIVAQPQNPPFNQNMSFGAGMKNRQNCPLSSSQAPEGFYGQNHQPLIQHTNIIQTYYAHPIAGYPMYANNPHQMPYYPPPPPQYPPTPNYQVKNPPPQQTPPQQILHQTNFSMAVQEHGNVQNAGPNSFPTKSILQFHKNTEREMEKKVAFVSDSEEERDKVFLQLQQSQNREKSAARRHLYRTQQEEREDKRGMIAKSLPIDPTLNKRANKQLNHYISTEKSVQSHINSNSKDFQIKGLKLNELRTRKKSDKVGDSRVQKFSLRYNTSLENELQIDPQIAADLAKYIS